MSSVILWHWHWPTVYLSCRGCCCIFTFRLMFFVRLTKETSCQSFATKWIMKKNCPILRNPKINYRIHYSPPPVPVLIQINRSMPHSHFLKIHFNITLPSIPRPSTWSLSFMFPHHSPVRISPLPHTCYMPHPSHSSWFDSLNNNRWGIQSIKLLFMQPTPLHCYLVPLRPKYLPQHPILEHPQPMTVPRRDRPSFTPM